MKHIEAGALDALLESLREAGYRNAGPTLRGNAIVYDEIESADDLPVGWRDSQECGRYRVENAGDRELFGFAVGPQTWKKFLFPAQQSLWSARRTSGGFRVEDPDGEKTRFALIGVRPCELAAMAIQDRVFSGGDHKDAPYHSRRESAFTVSVNCSRPGGTCFCTSMGTGPRAHEGFDLNLTEVVDPSGHYFLVTAGSDRGESILAQLPARDATSAEVAAAESLTARAAETMGRRLDQKGLKEALCENPDHPHWDDVAARCTSCGSCTMVCPTCFCTNVEDRTDLTGDHAERVRVWDSCFNIDFSYLHGGSIRQTPKSRYRQWLTHKLGTWVEQFGTSGCVGCGRCITWCPVGIDMTKEAQAIAEAAPVPG